jgi:hypothetical protein
LKKKHILKIPKIFAIFLSFIGDKLGDNFPINSNKLSKITSTLTFDDSKAREAFGWKPTSVIKEFRIYE